MPKRGRSLNRTLCILRIDTKEGDYMQKKLLPLAVAAAVLIVDGGLGLIKVSLLRFLKIHIMKNVTTPIHDHVRKKSGWSNAQVVFRFAIIQIVVSVAAVYMVMIQ